MTSDLLPLISPAVAVLVASVGASRWLWRKFEGRLERDLGVLNRIESQITESNGTVRSHTIQIARLEGAVFGARALDTQEKQP